MVDINRRAIHEILNTHVMFAMLDDVDKAVVASIFEARAFARDQVVAEQGTAIEGLYIVHSGRVRLKEDAEGKIESLGLSGTGSSFGEMSLLEDADWDYQIVAADDRVVMFFAPADSIRELVEDQPSIKEHFRATVGLVELAGLVRGLLGDAEYEQKDFLDILKKVGVKVVRQGETVFEQGVADPRLYFIERGQVDISWQPVEGDPIILDRESRGSLIGVPGALADIEPDGMQANSAVALRDVTVLVIQQTEVSRILEINVALHERLRLRAVELREAESLEQRSRERAEGVDLRIKLAEGLTEEEFSRFEEEKEISAFQVVRQNEEADCAAACLTMVLKHAEKNFQLGAIRELTSLHNEYPSPMEIISGAELLGIRAKATALSWLDLKRAKLPGIAAWEGFHYVVVYKVTETAVHIADPAEGIRKVRKADFLKSWSKAELLDPDIADAQSGVFILLEPTVQMEHLEPPKKPYLHFIRYITPHKKYLGEALLAALLINILSLASPLFIQTIIDTVIVHQDVALLNMMLAGMVMATGFMTLTTFAQSLLLNFTTARIDMRLVSEFYRHVLSLPMSFFHTHNKGEILTRFGENQKIRAIIAGQTITTILNMMMVVIYFFMMFAYNTKLAIIVAAFLPVYIGIVTYFTPRIKALNQEIFVANSQAQSFLIESLNGIEPLKATANEYMARSRWEDAFSGNVTRTYRLSKLALQSSSLFRMSTLFATVAVLWVGAQDVILGVMTVGELMGFNVLMGLVTAPVLQLVGLWSALQEVRIAVDRVADVLDVNPEQPLITDAENMPATLDQCEGRITFQDVNFSYVGGDQTHNVMRDFSLEIEAGMNVAFVGPSGCGKSTIAKMILGFNVPKSGECRIDGKDITQIDFSSLRRSIGVVLQQSFAFAGSVAENIALGDPSPNMQAVKEAAQMAGAHEFIINYPLGYQTLIGEKGMGLSGGQAQRICIARALYRKPKIMIFDEATSALDNESERRITEQIKKVVRGRTTISIAHRLSTIMHCDMICFIDDGQVQEHGTHPELIDPEYLRANGYKGLYYRLAMTQFDLPPLDDDISGEKAPAETAEAAEEETAETPEEAAEEAGDEDQVDDNKVPGKSTETAAKKTE